MSEDDTSPNDYSRKQLRRTLELLQPSYDARRFADMVSSDGSEARKQLSTPSDDDNDEEAVEALDYLKRRHKVEIDRLQADNKQRNWFFYFVILVTALPVIVASIAMGLYVLNGGGQAKPFILDISPPLLLR